MADFLSKIKAGDRVWVGRGQFRRSGGIQTVKKVTATQIVLEAGGPFDRFNRDTGYQRGGGFNCMVISGIATEAQSKYWENMLAEKARQNAAKKEEDAKREAKCAELRTLFPKNVGVDEAVDGKFTVSMYQLTEQQVRKLAAALKA